MHDDIHTRRTYPRIQGRLIIGLVLIVGLAFVVAFGEQAVKARQLSAEVAERRATIATMEEKRESLEARVEEYASGDYLAYAQRIARRDLNLSNPGETVLLIRWLPPPETTSAVSASDPVPATRTPNWRRWLDVLGLP